MRQTHDGQTATWQKENFRERNQTKVPKNILRFWSASKKKEKRKRKKGKGYPS